jgi:hypothetical protein
MRLLPSRIFRRFGLLLCVSLGFLAPQEDARAQAREDLVFRLDGAFRDSTNTRKMADSWTRVASYDTELRDGRLKLYVNVGKSSYVGAENNRDQVLYELGKPANKAIGWVRHDVAGYSACGMSAGHATRAWDCAIGIYRVYLSIEDPGKILDDEALLKVFAARLQGGQAAWPRIAGRSVEQTRGPKSPANPPGKVWTPQEAAAAAALASTCLALGLTGFAALLLQVRAGYPRSQALADLMNALKGRLPPDPFEAWKAKYKSLGWRYGESNGVAQFEPVAGSRNEQGWIYDAGQGAFVAPGAPRTPVSPVEGQVDPATGKVWSSNACEWQSRAYYDQERARVGRYEAGQASERAQAQAANAAAQQADSAETARLARGIAETKEAIADSYRLRGQVEGILDRLEARERSAGDYDANREQLIANMRERARDLALATDPRDSVAELQRLGRLAVSQGRPGFEASYTYRDAALDTALESGAVLSDMLLTRGAASAGLASYRETMQALELGESVPGAIFTGVKSGLVNYGAGKLMAYDMQAIGENPAVSGLVQRGNQIKLPLPWGAADDAAAAGQRIWGSGMKAITDDIEERALSRLPANSPARQIGEINQALREAGPNYNARLVNSGRRLDAGHLDPDTGKWVTDPVYEKGIAAWTKDPKYLSPQAQAAADAVRIDLKVRAAEDALETTYANHPELRGKITGLQNTGSHARMGSNYKGMTSDVDFTPLHDGTIRGRYAAGEFSREFDASVRKLTGGQLGAEDLKMNCYGNNTGAGALQTKAGRDLVDMMNQTSGTVNKVSGTKVTYRLNGGDPVETGPGTKWTTGDAASDAQKLRDLGDDLLNKHQQELHTMGSSSEELRQATKAYQRYRTMESKTIGGRSLDTDNGLLQQAQSGASGTLTPAEQDDLASQLLNAIRSGT